MYMPKLIKLNFCLEQGKGIFTMDQLYRINKSLVTLPLAVADPAYEVDDYISELFYIVLSRYYNLPSLEKAKIATAFVRNLFIKNIRAKKIQFKYSYTMRLAAEEDYLQHIVQNDIVAIYTGFKSKMDHEVIQYIDEVVHILLYEDKQINKKELVNRLGTSKYKLTKIQTRIRKAYEYI